MSATGAASAAAGPGPRALVVGASGYVGRAVVRALCARGIPTVAHVRPDSPRLEKLRGEFQGLGARVATTAWDEQAFADLCSEHGATCVFLALGTTLRRRLFGSRSSVRDGYAEVDFGLSALVIAACVRSGRGPRIVLVSAAGARAGSRSRYLAARGRLEDHLRASGAEFTIARPGLITGPDRAEFRPLERALAAVSDMTLLWAAVLGMQILRERYRSIGAAELAKALVAHGLDPASAGKVLLGERLRDFP